MIMVTAKEDYAQMVLEYLDQGYVVVNGEGIGGMTVDKLRLDGYKVVAVYPSHLEEEDID